MRKIVAASLAACIATSAMSGVLLAKNEKDWIRLYDEPCNHAGTLAMIPPDLRPKFQKARADIGGQSWYACWMPTQDGQRAFVLFEDGDSVALPLAIFKEDDGV